MNRRMFLSGIMSACGAVLAPAVFLNCSALAEIRPKSTPIDELLSDGARVMWIAAHPDDESLVGSILAKSSLVYNNPLYFLILTHGEGGECCRPEGCKPDLATIRAAEMKQAAEFYRAELQHEYFFNAPLPVESFPKRHEIANIWKQHKDPTSVVAEAVRRFRPDIIFTFDPDHGFTGHPEHQLASRFTSAGVRLAANHATEIDGLPPHRVGNVYFGLNRYWPFLLTGGGDPGPVTETWDATQVCINGEKCRDVMARFSKAHRSQDRDMGTVRRFKWMIDKIYLRRTDPFKEIYNPYELAE